MRPNGPRVLVTDPPAQETGLLVVGDTGPARGVVVAVGEGCPDIPVGALVWYRGNCGEEIVTSEGRVRVLAAECVLAWED
jgi:hypothetical protein